MTVPLIKTNFTAGEVAPSLFGHVDLARYAAACSTLRNFFVSYRGGAYSRAGTAFVGFSKQTGTNIPPVLIPFQFSITQGLALEFGNFYMRVIFNGAYVTEPAVIITHITNANPGVVSVTAMGISGATIASNAEVSLSYTPGDFITVAGGTYSAPGVLAVTSTTLLSVAVYIRATTGVYNPGDTITLAGGTHSTAAVVTVATTQVVSAIIISAGSAGSSVGKISLVGTTGTGTKFKAIGTLVGGSLVSIDAITLVGSYTANPSNPLLEPIASDGTVVGTPILSGATVSLIMGIGTFSVTVGGSYTANPSGGYMTQGATSGAGVGAIFYQPLFGVNNLTVHYGGVYSLLPSNPAAQLVTTGNGLGATFTLSSGAVPVFTNGDWVYIQGVNGMTEVNNLTYIVAGSNTSGFQLHDIYGNLVNTTGFSSYVSAGTVARIYTLPTIWAQADLSWIKYVQSADVMSLDCVNQTTGVEYPPQVLERFSDWFWTLRTAKAQTTSNPPTNVVGTATPPTTQTVYSPTGVVYYAYVVTCIAADGTESIASIIANVNSIIDIAATAGTITLTWNTVISNYGFYIYKFPPGYGAPIPAGSQPGFAGQGFGTQFIDNNITPDYQQAPPQHLDPFSNGQIPQIQTTAPGTGYTNAFLLINTSTGNDFIALPVIINGGVVAWIVQNAGENYAASDTATVSGDGTGATAVPLVGPQSGNYPSVPAYFQERRVHANSLNNPDTYNLSQPGAYLNYDRRVPPIASDAITGTPWGVQVNGIQWMIQTSGGLLVMTGLSAWLLVGAGSFATNVQPISPTTQDAVVQAFTGVSPFVVPIRINYDVIYVESKGSYYYDLPYQLYALSEPIDITELSTHLFANYTIVQNAWCEQPYKLLWAVRSDGILLSLTYYKSQQITGWARHDTQGRFESVCSVTEPPVDALYTVVKRTFTNGISFTVERMDNRQWKSTEDAWCVDCALEYPLTYPNATISASSATGLGAINGYSGLLSGLGYSTGTTFTVIDDNGEGPGSGAVITGSISGGAVTGLTISVAGTGYINPAIYANDPAGSAGGSGFMANLSLDNSVTFTATANIFSPSNISNVLRMGGGIAIIQSYTSSTVLAGTWIVPATSLIVDETTGLTSVPASQTAGNWSITAPITVVAGLNHLIGSYVTGLADGNIIPLTQVANDGTITLGTAASRIIIGLPYVAQLQTIKLDAGSPTVQGQRKKIAAATIRVEASGSFQSGVNQPDGSTFSPIQLAPQWNNLNVVPNNSMAYFANQTLPLYTGDVRVILASDFATQGQVAIQQSQPLPLAILALIPEILPGDVPDLQAKERGNKREQA